MIIYFLDYLIMHYFQGGGGGGGGKSIFQYFWDESLAIFAGNTQKYSKNNYSKIAQKVLNIKNNDIVVASDLAALRGSVMHWRLEVILSTVQHNKCSYGFWDSHQQEV